METVEIVIKIPKKCKELLNNGSKISWIDTIYYIDAIINGTVLPKDGDKVSLIDAITFIDAIVNGTILPEGHGRLIDADKLPYEDIECIDGRTYMVVNAYDIDNADTIIEADKEKEK